MKTKIRPRPPALTRRMSDKGLLSRRRFIQRLGAAAATIPIAGSILHSRGVAQDSDVPVRFLAVRSSHGTDRNRWIPRRSDGSEPGGADVALDELNFDYRYSLAAPIDTHPLRSKITVLDGLDKWANNAVGRNAEGHHGSGGALTGGLTFRNQEGRSSNASIDRWLFNQLGAGEGDHLINASVHATGHLPWKGMSYREDGNGVQLTLSPRQVFETVFRGFVPNPAAMPAVDYSGAERGIFDHVLRELRTLDAQLVGSERERLGQHLAAMERLHAELMPGTAMPRAMCTTMESDAPGPIEGFSSNNWEKVEESVRLHAQVIAQSFACGLSRVATLMHMDDQAAPYFGLPSVQAAHRGVGGEFHDPYTHRYWGARDDARIAGVWSLAQRWQTELFLLTLEQLDATIDPMDPRGDRTVLDNTIVYWVNEFGHGPHDQQGASEPAMIAGGGNGQFKLGRYLRLRDIDAGNLPNPRNPVPNGRLLTSIANAMGHDIGFYGDPGIGRDPGNFPAFHGDLSEIWS